MEKCCTSMAAGVSHPLLGQLDGTPGTIGRHRQFAPVKDTTKGRVRWEPPAGYGVGGRSGQSHPPKPPVLGRISVGAVKAAPSLFPRARYSRRFLWRWSFKFARGQSNSPVVNPG